MLLSVREYVCKFSLHVLSMLQSYQEATSGTIAYIINIHYNLHFKPQFW